MVILVIYLRMTTRARVLKGVVFEGDNINRNGFMSSVAKGPVVTTSEWLLFNHSRVK